MEYKFNDNDAGRAFHRGMPRRRTLVAAAVVLAVATGILWWRGYFPGWGAVGRSDAWRNISGTDECFPFTVKDGKGFIYQGTDYDNPTDPVVTRADWTITRGGRTFVLYEINPYGSALGTLDDDFEPDDFDPGISDDEIWESLWIGLLGENGEIVRKKKLATGVKEISGIRSALFFGFYVTAKKANGSRTAIFLKFPKPWPALKQSGDVWSNFKERMERLDDELWEDWPDNESGYAADWVSNRLEEKLGVEYRKAIDALKAMAATENRRAELEEELSMAINFAWDTAGDSHSTADNVHWGNFNDRMTRERTMEVYLRNWLEAAENQENWEIIRNAKGSLHGVSFAATSGVAVVTMPFKKWQLLLRLSPAKVSHENGAILVEYDLIAPCVQDSGYMVEQGTVPVESGK